MELIKKVHVTGIPRQHSLTHLPLDKIVASNIFKCVFLNENVQIFIKNSLNFVPKGPFDNNSALV